jgi:hypothetical protein
MFNSFLAKRGWRDDASAALEEAKRERGFAGREDIQTFLIFIKRRSKKTDLPQVGQTPVSGRKTERSP